MLAKIGFVVTAVALSVSTAVGQQQSYSFGNGPSEICGITANSVPDFYQRVSTSESHKPGGKTDWFEVYEADRGALGVEFAQWTFTLASEPAHPFVTCRSVFAVDGAFHMKRHVLCGASREACDSLVAEFEALDERLREEIGALGK